VESIHLVEGLAHVGLTVPDLDAALTMWCDDLGFTLERTFDLDHSVTAGTTGVRSSTIHAATVVLGVHRIELLEYRPSAAGAARIDPSQHGATHIALIVTDIDAVLAVCRNHGWTAVGAPHRLTTGTRAGTDIIYLHGPAGGTLELIAPPHAVAAP
jgi:catechol 2,3-dioxygenase-like lactoylglutathione lyase family enzyme